MSDETAADGVKGEDGGHPCLSCGACCALYRVTFHWLETTSGNPAGVPVDLVEPVDLHRVAMKGTLSKPVRCVALEGEVGCKVRCRIHAQRSSTCRDFRVSWEDGVHDADCDRARAAIGLPPLEPWS